MYRYVIFDFDGTIADSEGAVEEILTDLAQKYDHPKPNVREWKHRREMSMLYKIPEFLTILRHVPEFKAEYFHRIPEIKPFPGTLELLKEIFDSGRQVLFLSSNTVPNISAFLRCNGVSENIPIFSAKGFFSKNKALSAFRRAQHCRRDQILYVGDEVRDVEACYKAGIDIAFVTWGMDSERDLTEFVPKYIIHQPDDLRAILASLPDISYPSLRPKRLRRSRRVSNPHIIIRGKMVFRRK